MRTQTQTNTHVERAGLGSLSKKKEKKKTVQKKELETNPRFQKKYLWYKYIPLDTVKEVKEKILRNIIKKCRRVSRLIQNSNNQENAHNITKCHHLESQPSKEVGLHNRNKEKVVASSVVYQLDKVFGPLKTITSNWRPSNLKNKSPATLATYQNFKTPSPLVKETYGKPT